MCPKPRCHKTLSKMFGSPVKSYYSQAYQEILLRMGLIGFTVYKTKSADKRIKVLKTSSSRPAHSHH